jgi:hypothetical protein
MTDTAALKTIRLNLARAPGFPNGSDRHGYRFAAPLDDTGHLDAEAWKKYRDRCRVVRFWGGEEEEIGHLVHRPGGSWAFHYDLAGEDDDEAGFKLSNHVFNPGEYVSIRDAAGEFHTFIVVTVEDA